MAKKHIIVITGASGGLGGALLQQCALLPNTLLISISRSKPAVKITNHRHFSADLSSYRSTLSLLKKLSLFINKNQASHVTLINNAATIQPIGALPKISKKDIEPHFCLNLMSPILLTQVVSQYAPQKAVTVININSGAGKIPIANWSLYCASKAALLMFDRCILAETHSQKFRVISFLPGLIDTPMQSIIRSQKKSQMQDVARFKQYQKEGHLRSPAIVAQAIVKLLSHPTKYKGSEYDIKDLLS